MESALSSVALLGTRGVPARYGAFEQAADRIATLGGEGRIRWVIYCPEDRSSGRPMPARHGKAELTYVPHGDGPTAPLWYDARCLWHAARSGCDAVVMLGYGAGPLLLIPRLFGKPVLTNTDGFEYKRSKWPWYVRLYFRFAEAAAAFCSSALVSDSVHMTRYYERRYRRASTFIAYGTDRPAAEACVRAEDGLEGLYARHRLERRRYHVVAMRLEPENSIEMLLQAAESGALEHPILFVGPSTHAFERLLSRVPVGHPGVRVAGAIYDRALLYLIRRNACTYLHGHTVGGINPTILESLSTGTPVVARDTPYNREVLGDAGIYFDDAAGLVQGLRDVEGLGPTAWAARAARVADQGRAEFTWEYVVEAYERLVRSHLERARAAGGAADRG